MENFDHILLFKTNLEACHKKLLTQLLDNNAGVEAWNIDLDDADAVLRIVSATLNHQDIIKLITVHGYECCELT